MTHAANTREDNGSPKSVNWLLAMTIEERLGYLRQNAHLPPPDNDENIGKRLLNDWKQQPPFDESDFFRERIRATKASEKDIETALNLPYESTVTYNSYYFEDLLADLTDDPHEEYLLTKKRPPHEQFLYLILPLMGSGITRLKNKIHTLSGKKNYSALDLENIILDLRIDLQIMLTFMILRTCILELNVERVRETLVGSNETERFSSYIEKLKKPEYRIGFFSEYPVLLRSIHRKIELWIESSHELVARIIDDYSDITEYFFGNKAPGLVCHISMGEGDKHKKNRSVAFVEFSSELKIVYKPRNLSVDVAFQTLIKWCNNLLEKSDPQLNIYKVLPKNDYGWVEFISTHDCRDTEQVGRFYWRQGAFLALFYLFHSSDLHFENILASGEHPVFIDLESLVHPIVNSPDSATADQSVYFSPPFTVSNIGMLPEVLWPDAKGVGVDISGLGARKGQEMPFKTQMPDRVGTEFMHMAKHPGQVTSENNRAKINGLAVEPSDYKGHLIAGFKTFYKILLENRESLLSKKGIISNFEKVEQRRIFRPTQLYFSLIVDSTHPDNCRDASYRAKHLDKLWQFIPYQPWQKKIIFHEMRDIENDDIPYFSTQANSRDAIASNGECIKGLFSHSSMELIRHQISSLSEQDLATQIWIINSSFNRASMLKGSKDGWKRAIPSKNTATRLELEKEAVKIGQRLEELTIWSDERPYWVGHTISKSDLVGSFVPGMTGLYNGELGIALFFGYLGYITQDQRFTDLMRKTINWISSAIENGKSALFGSGVFSGYSGYMYVLSALGSIYDDKDFTKMAGEVFEKIESGIKSEKSHSIIGGASGTTLALQSYDTINKNNKSTSLIEDCCDKIAACHVKQKIGIGWVEDSDSEKPLTGFSHGNSGYATALMLGGSLTGNKYFMDLAWQAIVHERASFNPQKGNWIDHRETADTKNPFMVAWCHGAPGVGLSRIRMLPFIKPKKRREEFLSEIRTASATTLTAGIGSNHSLCHGDLGNLDFALQAAYTLEDKDLENNVYRYAKSILDDMQNSGWCCGGGSQIRSDYSLELPGLMLGLAGIGFGLLKLAHPNIVPSILTLESKTRR